MAATKSKSKKVNSHTVTITEGETEQSIRFWRRDDNPLMVRWSCGEDIEVNEAGVRGAIRQLERLPSGGNADARPAVIADLSRHHSRFSLHRDGRDIKFSNGSEIDFSMARADFVALPEKFKTLKKGPSTIYNEDEV